jgi:hypothetical protein
MAGESCRIAIYPYLREEIRRYLFCDDSILYKWSECQSARGTIICQGVPLVLVNGSGLVRHLFG